MCKVFELVMCIAICVLRMSTLWLDLKSDVPTVGTIHYVVNHLLHFMYIKFSNMLYVLQSVATLKKSEVPTLLRIHYVVNRHVLHFMYIKFVNF